MAESACAGEEGRSSSNAANATQERCDALAARVLAYCEARGLKIACAESLTGGLLADAFVRIPGASNVLLGSAVTYDINAKASILGVDGALLGREGAVHPEVAEQMAEGAARLYEQPQYGDKVIGLSTTGVAGPGPDGDKPAGLVYVGVSLPPCVAAGRAMRRTESVELRLHGTRSEVRRLTVACVLENLSQLLAIFQE
ncbi:CinA family protein [Bifidobacterium eulemuris]|nr:CinA family protein [Bifidobacterium eulemuris]